MKSVEAKNMDYCSTTTTTLYSPPTVCNTITENADQALRELALIDERLNNLLERLHGASDPEIKREHAGTITGKVADVLGLALIIADKTARLEATL